MQERMGRRIVFFPLPLQGHINPLFQLADIFYSKGFSISIICTRFNAPNPDNHPHFTFHTIDDGLSEEDATMKDMIALTIKLNETCANSLRECLSEMLSSGSAQERVACLISDAMCYSSQAVADSLNLRRIALRTSGISAFASSLAYPLIVEKGYLSMQDTEAMVPELPPLRMKDIPKVKSQVPGLYEELLSHMVKATKLSSGLIFNSFEELESRSLATVYQDLCISIFPIGPFHKRAPSTSASLLTEDRTSISWLDEQGPNSVVYVSFGSLAAFEKDDFIELAWGLANSGQPFLWVVRPDQGQGPGRFPDGFLEEVERRGHVVGWAPQREVLAHPAVGAFLTHNGWNSTLESVCEGVPMICLPRFSDQTINARYVSDVWRVGLNLEKSIERRAIERAVRSVLLEKEGKEIRARMACLRNKASECLDEGGSSSESFGTLVNRIRSF
uniref:UDP-glycosyltransferase 76F1 n=1 Tax=Rheum palmatum TaxID=137221 RepID=A0A7L9A324_RHEPA|nr:UDP-glycosyltransferase 76F1 [Rheum palmatum]